MRRRELRGRLRRMQSQLSTNTVQDWAKSFIETLQQPVPGTPIIITRTLRTKTQSDLVKKYRQAHKRLLLLDYDGSLVPFTEDYHDATPPKSLLQLIKDLCKDSRNDPGADQRPQR